MRITEQVTAEQVLAEAKARYGHVTGHELSIVYGEMMTKAHRDKHNAYYTPEPVAQFISRFALDAALAKLGPDPGQVLRIVAMDPACGAGVFLIEAAQKLAWEFAGRLVDDEPDDLLIMSVMPVVITECVFGVDIDPVGAELSRFALSIETDGVLKPEDLTRHVICGNVLEGASPPAMEERLQQCA